MRQPIHVDVPREPQKQLPVPKKLGVMDIHYPHPCIWGGQIVIDLIFSRQEHVQVPDVSAIPRNCI